MSAQGVLRVLFLMKKFDQQERARESDLKSAGKVGYSLPKYMIVLAHYIMIASFSLRLSCSRSESLHFVFHVSLSRLRADKTQQSFYVPPRRNDKRHVMQRERCSGAHTFTWAGSATDAHSLPLLGKWIKRWMNCKHSSFISRCRDRICALEWNNITIKCAAHFSLLVLLFSSSLHTYLPSLQI